jgi:hypothetical protein
LPPAKRVLGQVDGKAEALLTVKQVASEYLYKDTRFGRKKSNIFSIFMRFLCNKYRIYAEKPSEFNIYSYRLATKRRFALKTKVAISKV